MRKFLYKAKDNQKRMVEGVLDAATEQEALAQLSQMGYFPLSIQLAGTSAQGEAAPRSTGLFARIRRRDITFFTRQLADLLESGLTLMRALDVLGEQTESQRLRELLADLGSQVRDGRSLSDVLDLYPRVFSNLYVSMVKSGEVGGMLPGVLARLADFAEKEDELRTKLRTALAYPILIFMVGIGTIAVLLIFVVPKLVSMFQEVGQILPLPNCDHIGDKGRKNVTSA